MLGDFLKVVFKDGDIVDEEWNLYRLPFSKQFMNRIEYYHPSCVKNVKEINYTVYEITIKMAGDWFILKKGDYLGIDETGGLIPIYTEDIKAFKGTGMISYD